MAFGADLQIGWRAVVLDFFILFELAIFCDNSYLLHLSSNEIQRKESFYGFNDMNAASAIEYNADRLLIAVFYLHNDLATGTTGRNRLGKEMSLGKGRNGKGYHWSVGMLGISRKESSSLGTESRGESCIFLIAARNNKPIC